MEYQTLSRHQILTELKHFLKLFLKIIVVATICIAPLLGLNGNQGFEQSKVIFVVFSCMLGLISWEALSYLDRREIRFHFSYIKISSVIFISILLLTAYSGINSSISITGGYPYFQGWYLYFYLLIFSFIVSTLDINLRSYSTFLIGSAVAVSVVAISQYMLIHWFNIHLATYAGRVISTFGQPDLYAGFLVLILPFLDSKVFERDKLNKITIFLSYLIIIIAIVISQSRTALLVGAIYGVILLAIHFPKYKKIIIYTSLLCCSTYILYSAYFSTGIIWDEIIEPSTRQIYDPVKYSLEKRYFIYQLALQTISIKPIYGYGLGTFKTAIVDLKLNQVNPFVTPYLKQLVIDNPHNYILELLTSAGILGLISWSYLVLLLLIKAYSLPSKTVFFALLVYLMWVQFQVQSVVCLVFFWFLVGIIDRKIRD